MFSSPFIKTSVVLQREFVFKFDYYHIDKGYMLSFNFNKNKEVGTQTIQLGNKTIFEAVV